MKIRGIISVALAIALFMTVGIAPLCAAMEIQISEEYLSAFNGSDWRGYSIAQWYVLDDAAYGLFVMQKGDQNILCLIERQQGHTWKISGINEKILRPGILKMDDPQISGWDDYFWVCYSTPYHDKSGNWPEAYNFDRTEDDTWRLSGYAYYDTKQDCAYGLRLDDSGQYWIHKRGEAELNEAYVVQTPDLNFESIDPATMNVFIDDSVGMEAETSSPEN